MPFSKANAKWLTTLITKIQNDANEAMILIESLENQELEAEDVSNLYHCLDIEDDLASAAKVIKKYTKN